MKATRRQLETELARWMEFAMLCDSPLVKCTIFTGRYYLSLGEQRGCRTGLCNLIGHLSYFAGEPMRKRMNMYVPSGIHGYGYWWGHTPQDWQARSRFCWKMAELCQLDIESQ